MTRGYKSNVMTNTIQLKRRSPTKQRVRQGDDQPIKQGNNEGEDIREHTETRQDKLADDTMMKCRTETKSSTRGIRTRRSEETEDPAQNVQGRDTKQRGQ